MPVMGDYIPQIVKSNIFKFTASVRIPVVLPCMANFTKIGAPNRPHEVVNCNFDPIFKFWGSLNGSAKIRLARLKL